MSRIMKLVQLDKALLKPYYKSFILVFLIPLFVVYNAKDISFGIIFYMCMLSMTSSYTFSIAEKNNLNRLYGLLPVNKGDIVKGRYAFTALFGLAGIIVAIAVNSILLKLMGVSFDMDNVIAGIAIGLAFYFLFTAVQLPGFFKLGAIKGRYFSFIPLIGLSTIAIISNIVLKSTQKAETSDSFVSSFLNSSCGLLVCAVLFCIVAYGISIGISKRIFNKMEL